MRILLTAILFIMAAPVTMAGQEWPFAVAPAGCRFEWTGTDGYRETAFSQGVAQFPTILFSRTDWGPDAFPFVPFCGEPCMTDKGQAALRSLFPLKVGTATNFISDDQTIQISVDRLDRITALDGLPAYLVTTAFSGEPDIQSWWAPSVGWLVRFETQGFRKTVRQIDCPGGVQLPAATS